MGAFGEAADEISSKRQDWTVSGDGAEWVEEGESVTKVRFCVILHDRIRDHLLTDGKSCKLGVSLSLSELRRR